MERIYLDCCAYNRPYDDLTSIIINMEAQAKLHIQDKIRSGDYELVTSEMLLTEINDCPFEVRQRGILGFVEENSSLHVGASHNEEIDKKARIIMETGVKYKDACHVASAQVADCDYFITTDKRLLNYRDSKMKLMNPISFIKETEGEDYDG